MKKVLGTENRQAVLNRLGLTTQKVHVPKYIVRNGQVYKMVAGELVALMKVSKWRD